jgi:hypothetical protein
MKKKRIKRLKKRVDQRAVFYSGPFKTASPVVMLEADKQTAA